MSKLGGISLITLGSIGIGVALLRGTKHDPLMKIGVVKPKQKTKEETQFECDLLFQKVVSNFYEKFEINKRINYLSSPPEGSIVYSSWVVSDETKKEIDTLKKKYKEIEKQFIDSLNKYNESECHKKMPIGGCVSGIATYKGTPSNPNCLSYDELVSGGDCLSKARNFITTKKYWESVEKDLQLLSDLEFKNKYFTSSNSPKEYHQKNLSSKKSEINNLEQDYLKCNFNNLDCVSLQENINQYNIKLENLRKNPDSNRINSYVRADMNSVIQELEILNDLFKKSNCAIKSNIRKEVSYKDVKDCIALDVEMRNLVSEITFREKKKLELGDAWSNSSETNLKKIKDRYLSAQNEFLLKGCSVRLESQKLKDNALVLTEQAIKSEDSVLKKNFKEQYVYIGLGAVLLLSGFYIVLKK